MCLSYNSKPVLANCTVAMHQGAFKRPPDGPAGPSSAMVQTLHLPGVSYGMHTRVMHLLHMSFRQILSSGVHIAVSGMSAC